MRRLYAYAANKSAHNIFLNLILANWIFKKRVRRPLFLKTKYDSFFCYMDRNVFRFVQTALLTAIAFSKMPRLLHFQWDQPGNESEQSLFILARHFVFLLSFSVLFFFFCPTDRLTHFLEIEGDGKQKHFIGMTMALIGVNWWHCDTELVIKLLKLKNYC